MVGHLLVFTLLYYIAVIVGLETRIGSVALIWPANGIAFCYFILRPKREWPLYILGLSLGYIAGMSATGDYPWSIILGILVANILQTVVGAWLVKRFVPVPVNFSSTREIIVTLLFTAVIASFANAFFSVSLLGAGFMETPWQLWLSGVIDNAGSTIVTLPFLLVFMNTFSINQWLLQKWQRWLEGIVLSLFTIILTNYIFSLSYPSDILVRTLPYLLIPCILWAGLRFGQQGASLGTLFIAGAVVWHTLLHEGPFAMDESGFVLVLTVHMYISSVAITGLIVAALMKQQAIAMQSLAGGIAHEMRNPLGYIRYSLNAIRTNLGASRSDEIKVDSTATLTMHSAVENAEKAINRSLQVIELTLNGLYKNEIDRTKFEYLSAQSCVEKAITEYSFYSPEERNKVSLEVHRDFIFKGDETLFLHIMFNLLKNALYYLINLPSGKVIIRLESVQGKNQIIVRDNGPGISAQARQHLFDNFFTVGKKGGTGLGLAYCQRVMRAFYGFIKCESTEGEYTAFILSFPVVSKQEIIAYQQKQFALLEGRKILIIDDSAGNIYQCFKNLPEHNLDVVLENNIQFALRKMKQQDFDIVIMSIYQRHKDSLDGIRWIREGAIFSSGECVNHEAIPIVVFSDEIDLSAKEKMLATGASGFITKDDQLVTFINSLLAIISTADQQIELINIRRRLKHMTVLIVDDEQINRSYLKEILEPLDINVIEAEGGERALNILEHNTCDAVITDLQMPNMDGRQLAAAIRSGQDFSQFKRYNSIPIIAVSGNPLQIYEQGQLDSGINTLLTKPVDEDVLIKTLINQLQLNASDHTTVNVFEHNQKKMDRVTLAHSHTNANILAALLHDIVTPTLMLERQIKLLDANLPVLIDVYHSQKEQLDTLLSDENLASLHESVNTMAGTIHSIQLKQKQMRQRYDSDKGPDDETVEIFIQDINLFWQWISLFQSTSLEIILPTLLTAYSQVKEEALPDALVIEDKAWKGLNLIIVDGARAVSQAGACLQQYRKEMDEAE